MSDLYFRQWLSGRDFALDDDIARSMRNFSYVVGDREQGVALVVDPAYRPLEIVERLDDEGITVVGVVATHYHADHVGGQLGTWDVEGVAKLLEVVDVPIHVNRLEADELARRTGVPVTSLRVHDSGDSISVGALGCTFLHTPGHTPGSQCLVVDGRILTGDTLFIDGCGRTDLPGGSPEELYESLIHRLASVADQTTVFPGHDYSDVPFASMGEVRERNPVLSQSDRALWMAMFA